jgi:hypothetical protein
LSIIARIGVAAAVLGMVAVAYGLYQLLHLETCLSGNIAANAEPCTRHIGSDVIVLSIGVAVGVVGMLLAWMQTFAWLFPMFWIVEGIAALIAALNSRGAGYTNVSKKIATPMGLGFIAAGVVLLLAFRGVSGIVGWLNRSTAKLTSASMSTLAARGQVAAPPADRLDQLAQLAALRDRGAVTDAEFEAQKAKLLSDG